MRILDDLRALALDCRVSSISTAEGLRAFLGFRPEVIEFRRALDAQVLDDGDLRGFVSELLGQFVRGTRFPDESVLAAVAVAIETLPAQFAEQFLEDLARVRIAELPLAPRVARLSLRERHNRVSLLTVRDMTITEPVPQRWVPLREIHPQRVTSGLDDRLLRIPA